MGNPSEEKIETLSGHRQLKIPFPQKAVGTATGTPLPPNCVPDSSRSPTVAKLVSRFGRGALAFVAAKGTVFLLPLMFARSWNLRDYGRFEYSLAWGTLLAVPLGVGVGGAIPYFLLQREKPKYLGAFQLHALLAAAALVLLTIGYLVFGFPITSYLMAFIAGVIVIQSITSTLYKVWEAPERASVVESGIYVVLFLAAAPLAVLGRTLNFRLLLIILNLYAMFLVMVSMKGFWPVRHWRGQFVRYGHAIRFGSPVVLTSACIVFLATSTRLLAGKFFSIEEVGIYSFFFRITSPVVLIHSLLTTVYFRKLYQSGERSLDTYFSLILLTAFAAGLFLFVAMPPVCHGFFPLLRHLNGENLGVYWLLVAQMVFWVAMALAEFIIYRQDQATKFSIILMGTIGALLAGSFLLKFAGGLTLLTLSQVQLGSLFLAVLAQIFLLRRSGVRLVKTPILVVAVMGIYLCGMHFLPS
jgi:O-antigen/teichoic acid export membrane protein